MAYTSNTYSTANPTSVNQSTKTFGDTSKYNFNIEPFLQPFDFAGQKNEYKGTIRDYASAIDSQEKMPALYDRLSGQLDLARQRENVMRYGEAIDDLTSQLSALPNQVKANTRNSLVTDAQRQRMTQSQAQPLQENLQNLGRVAERAGARLASSEEELTKRMGQELAQQQKDLMPWEKEFSFLEQMQAREFAGYTFANQLELNRLIANQSTGKSWTTEEAERANKLALAEWSYKTALDSIKEQGNQARLTKKAPSDLATMYSAFMG